tara:strand:- start:66 stop:647 length:582 start_codon:yes stop_codon:yes gene_type:complete
MKATNEITQAATEIELHPFAHLGPAPYTFAGVWSMPARSLQGQNPEAYNRAMSEAPTRRCGSCHHCGAAITGHYLIRDASGTLHAVGSSCIKKAQKPGQRVPAFVALAMKAKREQDAKKRNARNAVKLAELAGLMADDSNLEKLASFGHSRGFRNRETGEPLTYLDEVNWMLSNAGTAGKIRTLKAITKLIAA